MSRNKSQKEAFEKLFKDEFEDDPNWLYFIIIISSLFLLIMVVWN